MKNRLLATSLALATPLISSAQNIASQPGIVNRSGERVTLLTGPQLLSPAVRPLQSSTISSELVSAGTTATGEAELQVALQRRWQAEQRLQDLRTLRARRAVHTFETPLPRAGAAALPPPESLRFDSTLQTEPAKTPAAPAAKP